MRIRRVVCFLLGAWIGTSIVLALNVYWTFNSMEEMLKSPPGQWSSGFLNAERFRISLWYAAGLETANTYEMWEDIQIPLGLLAAALLFLESSTRKLAAVPLLMTGLVIVLHVRINPEVAWLHRLFAGTPWWRPSIQRDQFWRLHAVYELVEAVKCVMGIGLTIVLLLSQTSKHVRRKRHHSDDDIYSETPRKAASS
jgi:hypothetical protein